MEAISLPMADHRASPAAEPGVAERISAPHPVGVVDATISVAQANRAAPNVATPHLLWDSLETAYSRPAEGPNFFYERAAGNDQRLVPYIAFPIAMAVSLGMWVAIVDLVLRR